MLGDDIAALGGVVWEARVRFVSGRRSLIRVVVSVPDGAAELALLDVIASADGVVVSNPESLALGKRLPAAGKVVTFECPPLRAIDVLGAVDSDAGASG